MSREHDRDAEIVGAGSSARYRPPGFIALALTAIGCAALIWWLNPAVNGEYTIYSAICEPHVKFRDCYVKGGKLQPFIPRTYRANATTQSVLFLIPGLAPIAYKKCAVADRKNWSCEYEDSSGTVQIVDGNFVDAPFREQGHSMDEIAMEYAVGQVSYLHWLWLHV